MRGSYLSFLCLALTACAVTPQADPTSPLAATMACVDALAKQQDRQVRDILVVNTETTAKGTEASLMIGEGGAPWRCRTDATGAVTALERSE